MKRLFLALVFLPAVAAAEPPADPAARKIYDHNKAWLAKSPGSFIAANIRGSGLQYAERRQAALDLLREKRDFGTVSDLMQELERNSFLSAQICDVLAEWKAKRAMPLLKKVAADRKRDKEVREHARLAYAEIEKAKPDAPPTF